MTIPTFTLPTFTSLNLLIFILLKMKKFNYEEAVAQIETIVRKMENDQLDVDSMTEQLKKAQELIRLCKDKLTKTDEEIQKILGESQSS